MYGVIDNSVEYSSTLHDEHADGLAVPARHQQFRAPKASKVDALTMRPKPSTMASLEKYLTTGKGHTNQHFFDDGLPLFRSDREQAQARTKKMKQSCPLVCEHLVTAQTPRHFTRSAHITTHSTSGAKGPVLVSHWSNTIVLPSAAVFRSMHRRVVNV